MASDRITSFFAAIEARELGMHSAMILRNGKVVAEARWDPYDPTIPHVLHSLSKSFTATAVGFAVSEGLVRLDDPVIKFFPDDCPATVSPNLANMRVRHVLSMSCGHDTDPMAGGVPSDNWVRHFLSWPVAREPGTHFLYNTLGSYMLSAIVTKVSGMDLMDYLKPRLLEPIGIPFMTSSKCPKGICHGGFGMRATVDYIARFGQLFLQDGVWEGKRVLPEGWVKTASQAHVSNGDDPNNDWAQGYGFQFWRCRHGAYRGDGAFGQYCVIHPEHQLVVAATSGTGDMGAILNAMWEHLLPAVQPPKGQGGERMPWRGVLPPREDGVVPTALLGSYRSDSTDFPTLSLSEKNGRLEVKLGRGSFEAGTQSWVRGMFDVKMEGEEPVACRIAPPKGVSTVIHIIDKTSPMRLDLTLTPTTDGLTMKLKPEIVLWGSSVEVSFKRA